MPSLDLLTSKDVAAELGVNLRTVSRLVASGRLQHAAKAPGVRGAFLFHPTEVRRYVREAHNLRAG